MACTSQVDKLHGQWICDAKATLKANETPDNKAIISNEVASTIFAAMLENIHMDIDTKNKKILFNISLLKKTQNYTLVSEDGNVIELDTGDKVLTYTVIDDNTIQVSNFTNEDKLTSIILRKVI